MASSSNSARRPQLIRSIVAFKSGRLALYRHQFRFATRLSDRNLWVGHTLDERIWNKYSIPTFIYRQQMRNTAVSGQLNMRASK